MDRLFRTSETPPTKLDTARDCMNAPRFRPTPFLPVLLGLGAFTLYLFTGARTVQWQDSGQFVLRIVSGELDNPWGLAMTHPLHYWLGRIAVGFFPGQAPWAVTGVSALGGGLAVGGVFACVRRLARRTSPALFATLTLMFAHTFWRFSGLPEVYSLSAALLIAQVYAFLRLRESENPTGWTAVFFLNGLAFANHNLALLTLPTWGLTFLTACARDRMTRRWLPAIAGGWILGASPYLGLIAHTMATTGEVMPVIRSALFGHDFGDEVTGALPALRYTAITVGFLLLSFPNFAVPLAARSAAPAPDAPARTPVQVPIILLTHLIFFLRYNVIDQYTFLIPSFTLIALLAGTGYASASLSRRMRRAAWLLLALQPFLYFMTPPLLRATGLLERLDLDRDKPLRDDYDYLFLPWTVGETSAARLAEKTLDAADPGGVIVVEDPMARYAVQWERLRRGRESTISILSPEEADSLDPDRSAVWVPRRADDVPPKGWEARGPVWLRNSDGLDTTDQSR